VTTATEPSPPPPGTGKMPTLLLVDDDPDTRLIYGRVLARAGYEVLEAASGGEAVGLASAARPDVVILDLGRPDMDGLDVARALRAGKDTQATRIIVFTAYVSAADEAEVRGVGCDLYLAKPVPPRDLVTLVQGLTGPRPSSPLAPRPAPAPGQSQSPPESPVGV